jgi:hypothetical protein
LTFPILIAALEDAHRRPKMEVLDAFLGDEKGQYVIRSAVDPGRYMASKMFTSFPANLADGKMPAVQAVCVLFDGTNGGRWRRWTAPRSRTGARRRTPRWARNCSPRPIPRRCCASVLVRCPSG